MTVKVKLGLLFCGTCVFLMAAAPSQVLAQNNNDSFQLDEQDLQSANERLLAAEAELLNKLSSEKKETSGSKTKAKTAKSPLDASNSSLVKRVNIMPAKKPVKAAAKKKVSNKPFNNMANEISGELESLQSENSALQSKVSYEKKSNTVIRGENSKLKAKLAASEQRVKVLLRQVREMRDSLIFAETEVERLSSIVEDFNIAKARRELGARGVSNRSGRADKNVLLTGRQKEKATDDMPIATVMVRKANLRAGPGKNNSPIMEVSKGTRLAVETRVGEWYRVIAPTGVRAWISADIVAYGRTPRSAPSRTVQVRGYKKNAEEDAFKLISGKSR